MPNVRDYDIFPVGDKPPFKYAVVHNPSGEWVGDLHWDRSSAESFIANLLAKDDAEHEMDDLGFTHRPPEPVRKDGPNAIRST